jgi:transcriptional regulator with XRE-family HTH domain
MSTKLKDLVIENLITLRKMRGLKPQHLADRTGLHKSMIHYVEKGGERSNTSIEKIEIFSKGLQVPTWVLFLDNKLVDRKHPEMALEWYELLCELSETNQIEAVAYMKKLLNSQLSCDGGEPESTG